MSQDSEFHDLVARACQRDPTAAAELVHRFEPELRRMIRFQLTDPRLRRFLDSLDVCQSVLAAFFAQLYEGSVRVSNARQLAGLLSLMAKHKVIDYARKHRSQRRGGGQIQNDIAAIGALVADPAPSPDERVIGHELVEVVREQLDSYERELLDRWLVGHDWPEIARAVGANPDAVRKRLTRAIDAAASSLGLIEDSA